MSVSHPKFTPIDALNLSPTQKLAAALLKRASVTPDDQGCQALIAERLSALGFKLEWLTADKVTNLWAYRGEGETLLFAGHTDVVPPGLLQAWDWPPFEPVVDEQGYLRARGVADMKSSLAAFVIAVENFVHANPDHQGRLALLLTSDEEGEAIHGTRHVVEILRERGERIDYCLVGEPSSDKKVGDIIKNGRRGSLTATLQIHGIQGHVAYPHRARNAIHLTSAFMQALLTTHWDDGNTHFPATQVQIVRFNSGAGANNVIPGEAELVFNFRYSSSISAEQLKQKVNALLSEQNLSSKDYTLSWQHSGLPFLTDTGRLLEAVTASIEAKQHITAQLSTDGGTSDGRFIATLGAQVIELGPCNATIHQVNERIHLSELDELTAIYGEIIKRLLR